MQRHEHDAKQQQYDSDLHTATEQADKASARQLLKRQVKATAQRQHEQQQRQQHRERCQYQPGGGGGSNNPASSGIQARLQALAMSQDADCSPAGL